MIFMGAYFQSREQKKNMGHNTERANALFFKKRAIKFLERGVCAPRISRGVNTAADDTIFKKSNVRFSLN